jgi:hypothetical protein
VGAPVPLKGLLGWKILAFDTGAIVLTAAVLGYAFVRERTRRALAMFGFLGALTALSLVGLTKVEINKSPLESHRFMTAASFVAALLGALSLRRHSAASIPTLLLLATLVFPAMSTLDWVLEICPVVCATPQSFGRQNFYAVNCLETCGARLGERTAPHYVDEAILHMFLGCRPTFTPGGAITWWRGIRTGGPAIGLDALRRLGEGMVGPDEPLQVECSPGDADAVCTLLRSKGACAPSGTLVEHCVLGPGDRRAILGSR